MQRSYHPSVPEKTLKKWQQAINLLAKIYEVPAVLITEVHQNHIGLLATSKNADNPFEACGFNQRSSDMYCDHVIDSERPLLVKDALESERWHKAPDVEQGMTFYLGYPLAWPDHQPFGTICVMDKQQNRRAIQQTTAIETIQQLINHDLKLLYELDSQQQYQQHLESQISTLNQEIENHSKDLDEAHTALRVLMQHRQTDQNILKKDFMAEISSQISPLLEDIRQGDLASPQKNALDKICQFLSIDESSKPPVPQYLSPAEMKVARLIHQGKSSKEIALLLHVSKKTIDYHRQNIRKKLAIDSKTSLSSYLTRYFPGT